MEVKEKYEGGRKREEVGDEYGGTCANVFRG